MPVLRHRLDLRADVVPGRAEPQHRPHALAHPGDRVLDAGALVVVGRAARDIAVERPAEIARGVVPADRLAGLLRGGDLAGHLRSFAATPGKFIISPSPMILGQAIASATSLASISAPAFSSPGADGTQHGISTKTLIGMADGLVMHQPDAREAQHIGDLVRVDEHRRRAVRNHRRSVSSAGSLAAGRLRLPAGRWHAHRVEHRRRSTRRQAGRAAGGARHSAAPVVVAFSGGADSAFLAAGRPPTLGATRRTPSPPCRRRWPAPSSTTARALAAEWGLRWTPVETDEMERAAYRINDTDRCFHCKAELMAVGRADRRRRAGDGGARGQHRRPERPPAGPARRRGGRGRVPARRRRVLQGRRACRVAGARPAHVGQAGGGVPGEPRSPTARR